MKISMSQITTMPTPLEDDLPAFAAAGFVAVELSLEKVNCFLATQPLEALKDRLATLGLRPTGAIGLAPKGPALLLSRGEAAADYLRSLREQLALCRALGIDQVGIGADSVAWLTEENWQAGAEHNLREAARMADDAGLRVGLEFMSLGAPIGPFVLDSLAGTRALVEAVGESSVGVNVDFFHHYRSGGSTEELKALPGDLIVGVHVTDVAGGEKDALGDGDRLLPGDGVLPLAAWRDAILASGFDGYWVLELLNEALWKMPPSEAAAEGMKAMKDFSNASGRDRRA